MVAESRPSPWSITQGDQALRRRLHFPDSPLGGLPTFEPPLIGFCGRLPATCRPIQFTSASSET